MLFEKWILRRQFEPKWYANGKRIKLYNEELRSLYRSSNIVRLIKSKRLTWTGHLATMEESWSAFKILIGTPTGNIRLGRLRNRWKDIIRMDVKEIVINAIGFIRLRIGITGGPL